MLESNELKRIKKLYGEKFMQLCRELFPTILEEEGKLLKILESSFAGNSRTLGEDITEDIAEDIKEKFKSYILNKVDKEKEEKIDIGDKTPYELLEEAGYDLYECKSEEDIQEFKKYYQTGEELCTFNGGRLNSCVVFWAVKKGADQIKREDFNEPKREDEYGTSVMSIQFSKGISCTVSIKNRYNHTVNNPDATYGNNLDRIVQGLTQSFKKLLSERNMILNSSNQEEFEIPYYIVADDGRYYKYNIETNNIYYCPGNVIIDVGGKVRKLESEKEQLIDYFILDKKRKTLKLYDSLIRDSFIDCFKNIEKIEVIKDPDKEKQTRIISIKTKESENIIKIKIDNDNNIVGYENQELKEVGDNFLVDNEKLSQLNLPKLEKVGKRFLHYNLNLKQLNLPRLKRVEMFFLNDNRQISQLDLPYLEEVGDWFLCCNRKLSRLELPMLKKVGNGFLYWNEQISQLNLPQFKEAGNSFLWNNNNLIQLYLPKLEKVGYSFMYGNIKLRQLNLPQLKEIGSNFLLANRNLNQIYLPNIKIIKIGFLNCNNKREQLIKNMYNFTSIRTRDIAKTDVNKKIAETEIRSSENTIIGIDDLKKAEEKQ